MEILQVDLGVRSYPIYIGSSLLDDPSLVSRYVRASQVLIVTNETIAPLYLEKVKKAFTNFQCDVIILPDGERYKTLETLSLVFDRLLRDKHSRTTTLIALGGGVIGDMTGFAAAAYQRGVAFIQIPTTLLAQVDSSVGGKTGVNHILGKNMIGAFHQPSCVLIDIATLKTLPEREFRSGFAEVLKYGLIADSAFFEWIEAHLDGVAARNPDDLIYAINVSCKTKAAIVALDEREDGIRALLNLGHTFGHAIESWQKYLGLLHGEAVSVGILMAAVLSRNLGLLPEREVVRIRTVLEAIGLPVLAPAGMTPEVFFEYMQRDKKVVDGRIRLILLGAIGKGMIFENAGKDEILRAIEECCKSAP